MVNKNKKHTKESSMPNISTEVEINGKKEDFVTSKWRPAMGWMYMMVCIFDFIVFPIMFTLVQFWETEAANDAFRQWIPITLQSGGFFHIAMGAVLGISAYGRTQEKTAAIEQGNTPQEDK
jgi:hypothetical protein